MKPPQRFLLQARTWHGVLHAYNAAHLSWIEAFVAAPLRERCIGESMANRSRVAAPALGLGRKEP
jgi:hypothetical protein